MADLAIPVSDFLGAGCTWTNCTQPDGSTSYSNSLCNADQMLSSTRCLIEELSDGFMLNSVMWSTGGLSEVIPLPRVAKHSWIDNNTTYIVLAIHTLPMGQEPAHDTCPISVVNGGYGSLIVPCASTANLSAMPGAAMTTVKGSAWVSRWLVENYSTPATPIPSTTPSVTPTTTPDSIVAIVLVLVAICRRRSSLKGENQGQTGLWDDDIITASRIPREKVRALNLMSRGAFGEVYSGDFNNQRVAIKMLLPNARRDLQLVNEFLTEAKMTARMDHLRIITFVGVAWDSLSDLCVVLEFMEGGDLRTLLSDYEKARRPVGFDREKVTIALQVAHALTYMHSLEPPVIHRDLKSRNILLNHSHEAKLTDFGISRECLETMTAGVGTSLWMAPEVMTGCMYDDKADMFSFGVVLPELDVHTLPYARVKQETQELHGRQMSDADLLRRVAMGTLSVEFSNAEPQSMREVGLACVSIDPSKRPSAAEALYKIQVILSNALM